jgi:hypothetical protein
VGQGDSALTRKSRSWAAFAVATGIAVMSCSPAEKPVKALGVAYDGWTDMPAGVPAAMYSERVHVGQILREGRGAQIASGDFVELHLRTRRAIRDGVSPGERDDGSGWVWIGVYEGGSSGPIWTSSSGNDQLVAVLTGLRQGAVQTFATKTEPHRSWEYLGSAGQLPFGDRDWYLRLAPKTAPNPGTQLGGGTVMADRGPAEDASVVEITRVCKGRALMRLIALTDESPIQLARHNDFLRTYESTEPRLMYLREAKWEGTCDDGAQVGFEYGPYQVHGPKGRPADSRIQSGLPYQWIKDAWSKVQVGVVVRKAWNRGSAYRDEP